MTDEIELVGDDEGAIVVGDRAAVERFLTGLGMLTQAKAFDLEKLRAAARAGADISSFISVVAEQSALYLKLTPESAKRLKDAGGLMPTKTKGISHVMLGETGKQSLKWLQAEDGPASLLTNPAVLSGVGGLLSQFAQQAEAQELKELLVRIDEKLDDVRRGQRDTVLARMRGAAASIAEAATIRDHGGDPKTWWDKVNGVSETLFTVQEEAQLALRALADKVDGKSKTGELKKVTEQIEREVAIQLAVLARCFELQDEFRVIELDHVRATAPGRIDGHRLGVADARAKRRSNVLEGTTRLMTQMDSAGGIANENILLHARAARSVIDSLNSTAAAVDDFHGPLGIESTRDSLSATPWREALRDPQQRLTAGKEAGRNALIGVAAVGAVVVPIITAVMKNGSKPNA
jgi:cell division protein ZapA (FtsZ GTPase activity inhibitor)